MRKISEVVEMVQAAGLTISEKNIIMLVDTKAVTKAAQGYEGILIPERKRGKPTKRTMIIAKSQNGHISQLTYSIDTTDVALRELFREVAKKDGITI